MNNRWYDNNPTVSMAISLLQNAPRTHCEQVTALLESRLTQYNPELSQYWTPEKPNFWQFLQKRKSMTSHAWRVIETMKFLPEPQLKSLALEVIHAVYSLEKHDEMELDCQSSQHIALL